MRSSTSVALLALSAIAAPSVALAAPTYARSEPVYARQNAASELLARSVPSEQESGALLPAVLGLTSLIPSVVNLFKGKRGEFESLMAREPVFCKTQACYDMVSSNPHITWAGIRPSISPLGTFKSARGLEEQESGALLPAVLGLTSLIPSVVNLFKGKREFDEVFARELEQELLARAAEDESGAILPAVLGLTSLIPSVVNLFKGKREFNEVFARELEQELLARAAEDESGALLPAVLGLTSLIPSVVNLFKGKREEFESLMAREPVVCKTQACYDMVSNNPHHIWAGIRPPTRPLGGFRSARSLVDLD